MMTIQRMIGVTAVLCLAAMGGCNVAGWIGQGIISDEPPTLNVTAEYRGLENQTVAVLVDTDYSVMDEYPLAPLEVSAALSSQIAANVTGVKVIDAKQVVDFQRRNIYWTTLRYSQLAKQLKVSRLVIVGLNEYRTHEPGNVNLYKGTISATVGVAEADGQRPDDMVYQSTVMASYPPESRMGVPDADPVTIRKGMIDLFAMQAGWKFYDHKEQRSE